MAAVAARDGRVTRLVVWATLVIVVSELASASITLIILIAACALVLTSQ